VSGQQPEPQELVLPPSLELWQLLATAANTPLIQAASTTVATDVAAISRLRRLGDAPLVNLSLDLASARRKLSMKWPERGDTLFADPSGAEMASSQLAASHKAQRFVSILGKDARILDLCTGIGGDAMALTEAGLRVLAVDHDPIRAWMSARNAGCDSRACDVLDTTLPSHPFHLDPSRRDSGTHKRLFTLEDHQPPPEVWRELISRHRAGAIKLGPGINPAAIAAYIPPETPHELEFLSERGRLTQCIAWLGPLARVPARSTESQAQPSTLHTATLLTDTSTNTLSGQPSEPPIAALARYLVESDASIERAHLLGELCERFDLHALHPGLGLLTGDNPPVSPFCTSFEVLAHTPWSEKQTRAWLREHDAGVIEIKTRDKAVEPDALQLRLRGEGVVPFTVFVLRWGTELQVTITKRMPRRTPGNAGV